MKLLSLKVFHSIWFEIQEWLNHHKLPSANRRVLIRLDAKSSLIQQATNANLLSFRSKNFGSGSSRVKPKSLGNSPLLLRKVIVYPGWDLLVHGWAGTLVGLDRDSEVYYESYALENKFIQATRRRIVYRRDPSDLVKETIPRAVVLVGSNMNQWGHCIQDLLFRYESVPERYRDWPIIVQEDTPRNFIAAFDEVYGSHNFIYAPTGQALRVRRAVVPLPQTRTPVGWKRGFELYSDIGGWFIDGPAIKRLRTRMSNRLRPSLPGQKYFYLARKGSYNRPLVNEIAVRAVFESFGFQIIYPEEFEFCQLLKVLDDSSVIAGVAGSQLLNLIFLRHKVEALILRNPFQPKEIFNQALEWAGHSVSDLEGIICVGDANRSEFEKAQQGFLVFEARLRDELVRIIGSRLPSDNRNL